MRICQVELRNFRGIKEGIISLPTHAVLLGANNAGKSTIVDSLALLFGRDRMVRPISDWDFYGGSPRPESRFYVICTLTGFPSDDPAQVPEWFIGENAAVPLWWKDDGHKLSTETDPPEGYSLATKVALACRFDDFHLGLLTFGSEAGGGSFDQSLTKQECDCQCGFLSRDINTFDQVEKVNILWQRL